MSFKRTLYAIATFIPGVSRLRAKGTGGTDSARYCYSVWLRHLVMARKSGLNTAPKVVAELGPGDSIGIGLAALISGCAEYYALDIVEHADVRRNVKIFDELVALFAKESPIPGEDEWPKVRPKLTDYRFPSDILDKDRLRLALEPRRIDRIRRSILNYRSPDSVISYQAPWHEADIIKQGSVDMIYSQAVLEHVDDLRKTYHAMYEWLNQSGYISHTIDFKCHGTADEWNGHWRYSGFVWAIMRGKRAYFINREPLSTHLGMLQQQGFTIVCNTRTISESRYSSDQLAPKFRTLSGDDLVTSDTFIQGVKSVTDAA